MIHVKVVLFFPLGHLILFSNVKGQHLHCIGPCLPFPLKPQASVELSLVLTHQQRLTMGDSGVK